MCFTLVFSYIFRNVICSVSLPFKTFMFCAWRKHLILGGQTGFLNEIWNLKEFLKIYKSVLSESICLWTLAIREPIYFNAQQNFPISNYYLITYKLWGENS